MSENRSRWENIHLGTHGEKYGNWMSAPVFYMVGGLLVLAAVLAVLFFTVFRITVPVVIFAAGAAARVAGRTYVRRLMRTVSADFSRHMHIHSYVRRHI